MRLNLKRLFVALTAVAASVIGTAGPSQAEDGRPVISDLSFEFCFFSEFPDDEPFALFDFRNTGTEAAYFRVYFDDRLVFDGWVGANETTVDYFDPATTVGAHEVVVHEIHHEEGGAESLHNSATKTVTITECASFDEGDIDFDGVPDASDQCPETNGERSLGGCPPLQTVEYRHDCAAIIIPTDYGFSPTDDHDSWYFSGDHITLPEAGEVQVDAQSAYEGPYTRLTFSREACLAEIGGNFVAMTPTRFLDTRTVNGNHKRPVAKNGTVELLVAGVRNIPEDASAVALNVTVVDAQGGYLTVHPSDVEAPLTSNLNYNRGQTVANQVISGLSEDGKVSIFASGQTNVIVDVTGYFRATSGYTPMTPNRLLDTRNAIGIETTTPIAQGGEVDVTVAGAETGVPDEAVAVALNLTSTQSKAAGWVTAYPTGESRPTASNLNYGPGRNVPGFAIVKVGDDRLVTLFSSRESHLLADVQGYFMPGGEYIGLTPARLVDTRVGTGAANRQVGVGQTLTFTVKGLQGVPAGATAVFLNVTTVNSDRNGYFTVFPSGIARPRASTLNFAKGQTVANSVLARIGADGKVSIYTTAKSDVLVDVAGYVTNEPPAA